MNFPEEEIEFGRCWSGAAGELFAVKSLIVELEKRSGEAFVRRRDDVAQALRDLAAEFGRRRDDLSKKVQDYIDEDKRRTTEKAMILRRMCR